MASCMVTISENFKVIGKKMYKILHKQSLAQTWMPTHIWVMVNYSKSRCPPLHKGRGGYITIAAITMMGMNKPTKLYIWVKHMTGFPLFWGNQIPDLFNSSSRFSRKKVEIKKTRLFCVIEYSVHFSFSNQFMIYCQICSFYTFYQRY